MRQASQMRTPKETATAMTVLGKRLASFCLVKPQTHTRPLPRKKANSPSRYASAYNAKPSNLIYVETQAELKANSRHITTHRRLCHGLIKALQAESHMCTGSQLESQHAVYKLTSVAPV